MYDIKNNSSHQITLEEASKYSLDPGPSSPDGYNVDYNYGHNGIFEIFGSNKNNNNYYISKGKAKKILIGLSFNQSYYYNNGAFNLIGWVK